MLRIAPFATILLILVVGCSQKMVGGACDYESRLGTAQVVAQGEEPLARFIVAGKGFVNTWVRYSPDMLFPFYGKTASEREDVPYPARLSVITRGSCTPYRLTLLSNQSFSQGIFFPVHEVATLQVEATQTLSEIATLYRRLAPVWPKLMIDVCGQTVQQGSSEYNFSLGNRYAQRAVDVLHGMNVPLGQLHVGSAGENPCPHSDVFLEETQNGVWVTFLLTGIDTLNDNDLATAQFGAQEAERIDTALEYFAMPSIK